MSNDNGGKISKREQHIRYAVMLLEAGVLAIVLPRRLTKDLGLNQAQASYVAKAAIKRQQEK